MSKTMLVVVTVAATLAVMKVSNNVAMLAPLAGVLNKVTA